MAYQGISTGTTPNDNTGDSLFAGAIKINSNFKEIYNALGGQSGTIPISISISGTSLIFSAVGIGSTTLKLA